MTQQISGVYGIGVLILLTFRRVPLGAAMGFVGLVGYAAIDGWHKAFVVFGTTPYSLANYGISVLPLFILMGTVATRSGMSRELFDAANALFAGRNEGTENWAMPASPIATCKLYSLDPEASLTHGLAKLLNNGPGELSP